MEVSLGARMCQSFCMRNADWEGNSSGLGAEPSSESVSRRCENRSGLDGLRTSVACFLSAFFLACSSLPPHPKFLPSDRGFSDEIAQAHLENLAGLGPRLPGSEADQAARGYIEREFRLVGARIGRLEFDGYRHLIAEIPGASEDSILLVAPYSTLGSDEWVDDSGAALLLELSRVLASDPTPYTVRIALAETRPTEGQGTSGTAVSAARGPIGSSLARQRVSLAGVSLANALDASGGLWGLRAVIAFEPRAGVATRMARDLRSHPVFRSVFWEAAAALGHGASFPSDAGWRSPAGLQGAFRARGLGQVLALVDETTARAELLAGPGERERPPLDPPAGLEPVGSVTLEALSRLMRRFERADAFSK